MCILFIDDNLMFTVLFYHFQTINNKIFACVCFLSSQSDQRPEYKLDFESLLTYNVACLRLLAAAEPAHRNGREREKRITNSNTLAKWMKRISIPNELGTGHRTNMEDDQW